VTFRRFFENVAPGEQVTFQTFGEGSQKAPTLRAIRHGYPHEVFGALGALNARGAGVFWMANQGDGRGRTKKNVVAVRHAFLDLDGAPLEPVLESASPPEIVVETSPDRFHCYWLWIDCPLESFGPMQLLLAKRFNGDESVSDLPRVLRVPGFVHRKGTPFTTRIVRAPK
jgi:hypothetical protein